MEKLRDFLICILCLVAIIYLWTMIMGDYENAINNLLENFK